MAFADYDPSVLHSALSQLKTDGIYGSLEIMSDAGLAGSNGQAYLDEVLKHDSSHIVAATEQALTTLQRQQGQLPTAAERRKAKEALNRINTMLNSGILRDLGRTIVAPFRDPQTGRMKRIDDTNQAYDAQFISQMTTEFQKHQATEEDDEGSLSDEPKSTSGARVLEKFLCDATKGNCQDDE